jgi:hypothetical protein
MFSADAWADVWSEPATHLNVTGGVVHPDGTNDFLIWELDHKLLKGDHLLFEFGEGDQTSRAPEVFDDQKAKSEMRRDSAPWDSPPSPKQIEEMEARAVKSPDLVWYFSKNSEQKLPYRPGPGRQQLAFGLLWNSQRPERMRVSLRSTSLREVLARQGGIEHLVEYVPIGTRFELDVGA